MRKLSFMVAVMALLFAGCGQSSRKQSVADAGKSEEETIVRDFDGWEAVWIQDLAAKQSLDIFPDVEDSLVDSLGLRDGVPSSISAFLLRKGNVRMLFDAGLGGGESRMLPLLDSLGLKANDINYLFLTHLHNDHIGGMLQGDTVVFPNADVFVAKQEYDGWMCMDAGKKEKVEKIMGAYSGQLHLFEFGDSLPCGVEAIDASGHTPGHTVYKVGKLLIVGDLMHGVALQLKHPWICASYDMDKQASIAARERILRLAEDSVFVMGGMHFPAPGFLSLSGDGD